MKHIAKQDFIWTGLDRGGGEYADTGLGRLTIRSVPDGRVLLRINGQVAATFSTIEEAKSDGAQRVEHMRAARAEEDAWYESWPERRRTVSAA